MTGSGPSTAVFLTQIVVLLAAGRVAGEVMHRLGQPVVMGQLVAGILLGPSVLGALSPGAEQALFPSAPEQKAMLHAVTELGILMLLLLAGMETDLRLVRKVGRASLSIAGTGLAIPFACGFLLGQLLPASLLPHPEMRLITSLFLGTALAMSSVKIVAMVVREMNFTRRDIGQIVVSSAVLEDSIGWIVIALTLGVAASGAFEIAAFAKTAIGAVLFLAFSFTFGRRLVARSIRWANDSFESELPVITVVLVIMGVMALITDAIGVHTVLGAFVAGMLVGQSPILTGHVDAELRGLITALFMPVFFAVAGLGVDLTVLADPRLLGLTVLTVAIASVGKFAGAFVGGRLGGLTRQESLVVGSAMNARGSTEIVVASIGLSMQALSQDLYTMIVCMALLTTLAMPPMLKRGLSRLPMREEERRRLERESREAKSFIPSMERLLLTVDESANARLAATIAGLIAGPREVQTTVLNVAGARGDATETDDNPNAARQIVRTKAETARGHPGDEPLTDIDVTEEHAAPDDDKPLPDRIDEVARKGYDLLLIGIAPAARPDGMISADVDHAVRSYEGPLAIADARGLHVLATTPSRFSILLPIRSTAHSQRAAEFALEIARASNSRVEAVFVAEADPARRMSPAARVEAESALKKVASLAETQGLSVRTSVRRGRSPAEVIVKAAARGRHDLVVIGVSRRESETLFFGAVAAEVLRDSPASLLLVCV